MDSMEMSINRVISNYGGSIKKQKSDIVQSEISLYVAEVIKKSKVAYESNMRMAKRDFIPTSYL